MRDLGSEDFRTLFDFLALLVLTSLATAIIIGPLSFKLTRLSLLVDYLIDFIFWMNSLALVDLRMRRENMLNRPFSMMNLRVWSSIWLSIVYLKRKRR